MPSRNAPCPCGSGRKYKKCHGLPGGEADFPPDPPRGGLDADDPVESAFVGDLEEGEPADEADLEFPLTAVPRSMKASIIPPAAPGGERALALHTVDERVSRRMLSFLAREAPSFEAVVGAYRGASPSEDPQLFSSWVLFHYEWEGRSAASRFLEAERRSLRTDHREWLEDALRARLSLWEVLAAVPGSTLELRDLLTGDRRTVLEGRGSRRLSPFHVLLCRVLDHQGFSVLSGTHSRALNPRDGAAVLLSVRERFAEAGLPFDDATLRRRRAATILLRAFEKEIARAEAAPPPGLQNTDGDPLEPVEDRYSLAPGGKEEVLRRLSALEGADAGESGGVHDVVFTRPGFVGAPSLQNTIVGRAFLEGGVLRLETNSRRRADALRERVEGACGPLLAPLGRTMKDVAELLARARKEGAAPVPAPPPSPGAEERMRQVRSEIQAAWPDTPLPAFQGRTPREAAKTEEGRAALRLMLKEFAHRDHRLPEEQRFDVDGLRRELGLPEL